MNVDELKRFAADLERYGLKCDLLLYGSEARADDDDTPGVEPRVRLVRYRMPESNEIPLAMLRVTGPSGIVEFHWSADDPDELRYRGATELDSDDAEEWEEFNEVEADQ